MTGNGQAVASGNARVYGPMVGVNSGTIIYQQVVAQPSEREVLAVARQQLHELPRETVPAVSTLPRGSRMTQGTNVISVGREADLRTVAGFLKREYGDTDRVEPIVVAGITGVGKTHLAIEVAHRYGQFFAGGVYWLSFVDRTRIPFEIAACGVAMNPPLHESYATLSLEQQVRLTLAAWKSDLPRLLIFDHCDDERLLAEWLPPTGGCRVLVTSRQPEWLPTSGVQLHTLRRLDRSVSIALLRAYRPDVPGDDPALHALAVELGDLPLALHIVGSFLAVHRGAGFATPAAYLAYLRQVGTPDPPSTGTSGDAGDAGSSITRTFELCYRQLDTPDPVDVDARQLLAHAICFAPDQAIPRELLFAAQQVAPDDLLGQVRASRALDRLMDLGLIETDIDGSVRLHRLVVGALRPILQDQAAAANVAATLLTRGEALLAAGEHAALAVLQPHLRALATSQDLQLPGGVARVYDVLAAHLYALGSYATALEYAEQSLRSREQTLGAQHADTATSLQQVGVVLHVLGRYQEAKAVLERALAVRERVLGADHVDVATTLHQLGMLLNDLGEYAAAQQYVERGLRIRQTVLGSEDPATATSLHQLGRLLQAMGNLRAAEPYYKRALATRERIRAPEPHIASSWTDLGRLALDKGELDEAQTAFERALAIRERVWGPNHPEVAISLNNLGSVYRAQGKYDAARNAYERARAIREQVLGPQHPDTAQILSSLGILMRLQQDYPTARRYYEQALATQQQMLGPDHPDTSATLNNLGLVCRFAKDYRAAQHYLEQALKIREQRLGLEHPDTATTLNNLGNLMRLQRDFAAAESYLQRALAIRERQLDEAHPDRAATLTNLGYLYQDQHDLERAQMYFEQALMIREQVPGADPMKLVDSLVNLAELATEQGNSGGAQTYYTRALAIIERRLGEAAPQAHKLRAALAAVAPQTTQRPAH